MYTHVPPHGPAAWAAVLVLAALNGCGASGGAGDAGAGGAPNGANMPPAASPAPAPQASPPAPPPLPGPKVIFFDDFTGNSLSSAWTVISRHGEYAQSETECNIPDQVSVAGGSLTITTAARPFTCGDFNTDGSVRHAPASWPYVTGDIQWRSFSFTYGTVTVRAKFPPQATVLWPAIWLLGANCQKTNPYTADLNYETCPGIGSVDYAEIDMIECDTNNWCQLALANLANAGSGGTSFPTCGYPVSAEFHTFTLTWTPQAVTVVVDGQPTGCSFTSPAWTIPSTPMFLIIQTQTGGAGGAPNDAQLPASLQVDYVRITQP